VESDKLVMAVKWCRENFPGGTSVSVYGNPHSTRWGRVWFSEIDWWTTLLLLHHPLTPGREAIYEESISHVEFGTERYSPLLQFHRQTRGIRMRVYGLSRTGCAMKMGNSLQCTSCIIVSVLLKFKLNYKLVWCRIHKSSEIRSVRMDQILSYLLNTFCRLLVMHLIRFQKQSSLIQRSDIHLTIFFLIFKTDNRIYILYWYFIPIINLKNYV